jgi:hypothetical protein
MFGKRILIPIVVLIVVTLACVPVLDLPGIPDLPENPDPPKIIEPDVARKDGECSDPRFKEAELAAYQALVQAQTDAANTLKVQIDLIEATYKKSLSKLNDSYQSTLNTCTDTSCTLGAKAEYDKWVARAQVYHDDDVYVAQWKEQAAIEAAQVLYYAEVEKARQRFCGAAAYQIVGGLDDWQTDTSVCNIMGPFTLTSPILSLQFSGGLSGTYSYSGGPNDAHGGYVYTISLPDGVGKPGTMTGSGVGCVETPLGTFCNPGVEQYALTPLDPGAGCTQ